MLASSIFAFDHIYRLSADAEILVGQFGNRRRKEFLRNVHYFRRHFRQAFYQQRFLLVAQRAAFDFYIRHDPSPFE